MFYTFTIGKDLQPDTWIFFYGGSGCASWKYVMPDYVNGLTVSARLFVLNKRFVGDRSTGIFGCSHEYHLANNPQQWVADYTEFIKSRLNAFQNKPKNVILVGVSEGALPAVKSANLLSEVTHMAIIGDGAYSMRRMLVTLAKKQGARLDIESVWKEVQTDPTSIEKAWMGHPYIYWTKVMNIDPLPDYLELDIPIFVAIGELDGSVPVESAHYLQSEFMKAGKRNLKLTVYPGANHQLQSECCNYRALFFKQLSQDLQ